MAFTPCEKIDIHLHLAYENEQQGNRDISTYLEMLPYFEKRNIVKGIVVTGGTMLPTLPQSLPVRG